MCYLLGIWLDWWARWPRSLGEGSFGQTQGADAGILVFTTETVAEQFWDTVSGGFLDPMRVTCARAEGIKWAESAVLFDPLH